MIFLPSPPRRGGEQLSGAEDGVVPYDGNGLCRFDVQASGQSVGVFAITSAHPGPGWLPSRDYWWWQATPWPATFELHPAPQVAVPSVSPEVHPQLVFTGTATTHDLSGTTAWRVRRGELVGGTPHFEDLGFCARDASGALSWFADVTPGPGYFPVPAGTWLRLVRLNNPPLVVQGVRALPGVIA